MAESIKEIPTKEIDGVKIKRTTTITEVTQTKLQDKINRHDKKQRNSKSISQRERN